MDNSQLGVIFHPVTAKRIAMSIALVYLQDHIRTLIRDLYLRFFCVCYLYFVLQLLVACISEIMKRENLKLLDYLLIKFNKKCR